MSRLRQRGRNRAERRRELRADNLHRCKRSDGDQCGEQAVFDGGCTALVANEPGNLSHVPLSFLCFGSDKFTGWTVGRQLIAKLVPRVTTGSPILSIGLRLVSERVACVTVGRPRSRSRQGSHRASHLKHDWCSENPALHDRYTRRGCGGNPASSARTPSKLAYPVPSRRATGPGRPAGQKKARPGFWPRRALFGVALVFSRLRERRSDLAEGRRQLRSDNFHGGKRGDGDQCGQKPVLDCRRARLVLDKVHHDAFPLLFLCVVLLSPELQRVCRAELGGILSKEDARTENPLPVRNATRSGRKKTALVLSNQGGCCFADLTGTYDIEAPTVLKVDDSFVPTIFIAARAAIEIKAASRPYSIAVAPDSSLIKVIMVRFPFLLLALF